VPAGLGFHRVTAVQETKVDVSLWHIARIPYIPRKSCFVNHAGTKKWTARIVTNNKSVPARAYLHRYVASLVPTSPVWRSSPLRTQVSNSHQRSTSHRLDSSPTPLPHWICLESVFWNSQTSSLRKDCPRLFSDPTAHLL
jgi:hypothetical protein